MFGCRLEYFLGVFDSPLECFGGIYRDVLVNGKVVLEAAKKVKIGCIRAHIDKLRNVCNDILFKDGYMTKY